MPITTLAVQISMFYWILLILLSVAIIGISAFYYLKNKNFHMNFSQTLLEMAASIRELQRYSIDNLNDVTDILDSSEYTLLSDAAYKLKNDSSRLYSEQWISDPEEVFASKKILNKVQYNSYSFETCIYLLTTGILSSLMLLILNLGMNGDRKFMGTLSLIPLFASFICSIILALDIKKRREDLERNLLHLSESIKERVPVFRELAGTAALIEAFFRYDRSMSNSVAELSSIIQDLASKKIAEQVGENIKQSLENELLPVIVDSANSLNTAAKNLESERNEGLSKLADQYSTAITSSMETHLQPFYQELENMANNIYESNKSTELSLQSIENFRNESINLQTRLTSSLDALKQANETWTVNLAAIASSTATLSQISNRLSEQQVKNESELSNSLKLLQSDINKFERNFSALNEALSKNNEQVLQRLENSTVDNEKLLLSIKDLGAIFNEQSQALNKQSLEIASEVQNLNSGLNASIQNFSAGINAGVLNVLEDFDNSLAEITDRLSNTTAEIDDTVDNWVREARYQESRRQRQASNGKMNSRNTQSRERTEIFDFLTSDLGRSEQSYDASSTDLNRDSNNFILDEQKQDFDYNAIEEDKNE